MPITLRMAEERKTEKRRPERRRPEKLQEKAVFQGEPAQGAPVNPPTTLLGRNHRVLVVDDNPVVLKAFELKLKASGFEVATASNGGTVASTAEQARAELVILDINFPPEGTMEWTGFTIMRWLRRFPELTNLPVIFITGTDCPGCLEKALSAGAIALFHKPVDFKQLLATMLEALGEKPEPEVADSAVIGGITVTSLNPAKGA
jgi:CheY-like chemotaxis protein